MTVRKFQIAACLDIEMMADDVNFSTSDIMVSLKPEARAELHKLVQKIFGDAVDIDNISAASMDITKISVVERSG